MKKRIVVIIGTLMVVTVAWMGYISIKKLDKKQTIQERQSELSEMFDQLGQVDLPIKASTILIFFNSECEHCQWEMEEISNKIDEFSQYQLLLVSFEPEEEAIAFLSKQDLSTYYIKSTPDRVMTAFTGGVPQTLLYRDGKLIKHFKGEVKVDAILGVLEGK